MDTGSFAFYDTTSGKAGRARERALLETGKIESRGAARNDDVTKHAKILRETSIEGRFCAGNISANELPTIVVGKMRYHYRFLREIEFIECRAIFSREI